MAEGDVTIFAGIIGAMGRGDVALGDSDTITIKAILVDSDFTLNADTQVLYGDVSASEYGSSDGYTAGGITLSGYTWTYDSDNVRWAFDLGDAVFSSIGPLEGTATPSYMLTYIDGAAASDDFLVAGMENGTTPNGGDLTFAFNAGGLFYSS